MEKAVKAEEQKKKKLWLVLLVLAVIFTSFYGIIRMVYAEDFGSVEWTGSFKYTDSSWAYSTKSYATVTWTDANGTIRGQLTDKADRLYSKQYSSLKHGFSRTTSNGVANLKMNQNELYAYLKNVKGWDIKVGDTLSWVANAEVTFKFIGVTAPYCPQTYDNVDLAIAANKVDRSIRRKKLQRMFPNNDFSNWTDRGPVFFEILMKDEGNKLVGYCTSFGGSSYWKSLCEDNSFKVSQEHTGRITVTVQYVSAEGEQLQLPEIEQKAAGDNISHEAKSSLTYNGSTYNFTSAKWKTATKEGASSTNAISVPNCEESVVITCYYEKEKPPVVPGKKNVTIIQQYYKTNTETGEKTLENATSVTTSVTEGTDQNFNFALAQVDGGHNYEITSCSVNPDSGLSVTVGGGNGYLVGGTIKADATITVVSNRNFTPEPHVCTYGPWIDDESKHWKECTECGEKGEEGPHEWETTEPDATGQVTKTCTVCGRTDTVHQHNWIGWYPTYYWGIQLDENVWHWKTCSFCDMLGPRGEHIAGEPVKEGGYMITRCTVCDWIMDKEPIMITLTLNPNGGTFPDDTTQMKEFEIQFDALTDMGNISPEYIPTHPSAGEFQGFYVITPYFEGVFYNQKGIAGSQYFKDNGNGTYTSLLTEDYIVHAQYRQGEHIVTYNPGGAGNGIMFPTYFQLNVPQALSPNGFGDATNITYDTGDVEAVVHSTLANTQVGWTFMGWGETESAGADYSDGQTLTFTQSGSTELFAKWSYGTITLPNASATNNGMKLYGWQKPDGTVIPVLDSYGNFTNVSYTLTDKDESFSAVWIPNTYTVTFECMNGTSHHTAKQVTYKQTYGSLPVCTVYGYDFLGWKMKHTGVDIVAQSIVTTASNHTLVAQYEPKDVTIKLDYNFNYDTAVSVYKKNSSLSAVDWQTDTFTIKFGTAVGTLPTPEMEGYTFAGWYTEESGNNGCGENAHMVQAGTTPTSVTTYTYYARWTKDEYRVDLDYNRDYSVWE